MTASTGLLTIDLNAIVANWRYLRAYVATAEVCAVIKADAYGLGAEPVGRALYGAGCRRFFFATLPEAVDARRYLPADAHCYVLGVVPAGQESLLQVHALTPVLSSMADVRQWRVWRAKAAGAPQCVVKFDSGMTRMGLDESELDELAQAAGGFEALGVECVMSHLACADEPGHSMNEQQQQRFAHVCERLRVSHPRLQFSLANSSGIFLGERYHYDRVRPGAALYGYAPDPEQANPMRAVVSLTLPLLQLRKLSRRAHVGYGATRSLDEGRVLAVVAGGYADGLHRLLGPAGVAMCGGVKVPVVGRVSMDTTLFDVSEVPGIDQWLGKPLSEVPLSFVVLGPELGLSEITQRNGALGYEVLTSLGSGRYRRRYLEVGDD